MFFPELITNKGNGKDMLGLAYLFEVEGRALKYYHVLILQKRK